MPCLTARGNGKVMDVTSQASLSERGAHFELVEEADTRAEHRPLTQKVSLWLFGVFGVFLSIAAVCIVMYRTGSLDDVSWNYLAIAFGCLGALIGFFACLARALDDI